MHILVVALEDTFEVGRSQVQALGHILGLVDKRGPSRELVVVVVVVAYIGNLVVVVVGRVVLHKDLQVGKDLHMALQEEVVLVELVELIHLHCLLHHQRLGQVVVLLGQLLVLGFVVVSGHQFHHHWHHSYFAVLLGYHQYHYH